MPVKNGKASDTHREKLSVSQKAAWARRKKVAELEDFKRRVILCWEAHKNCGPECSLNDELEVILNP